MIQVTTLDSAAAKLSIISFVRSLAPRIATPKRTAHRQILMMFASAMEVIGFFTTFIKVSAGLLRFPAGRGFFSSLCKCQGDREQFTCDDRDHSAEQCVEQVKADNGADDAAVALLCLAGKTDNKEKYEQGRDAL